MQAQSVLNAQTGFVSDVHLSLDQPALLQHFLHSVEQCRGRMTQLLILGDLFDSWVGDDALPLPLAQTVVQALRGLQIPIGICVGNRDFLLGGVFAHAINATLLGDETRFVVHGDDLPSHVLVAHGDQFCTADVEYQRFRKNARSTQWQRAFLAQPLDQRLGLAARLRMESETAKKDKPLAIMDVTAHAIAEAFARFEVDTLIHGHTHRPAAHALEVNGHTCWRHVLPDWGVEAGTTTGEILSLAQLVSQRQP